MIEQKKIKKLKEKRKGIITRLKELGYFPQNLNLLTEEQKKIYEQLEQFNFSYWEKVKIERGWVHESKSPEEKRLREKRGYIREYFRRKGVLPAFGEPLNEEQQRIFDQIENNDFTYHEEYVSNIKTNNTLERSDEIQLVDSRKRGRVRSQLRKYNVLPPYGEPLNEEQQRIFDQIENNDFTFYDEFIKTAAKNASSDKVVENSRPKMVLHRLRMVQILPKSGDPLNEQHEEIINDVKDNWEGKTKNHFITKYLHLSTPEGRLFYRLYKAHRDFGYNFNITVEDIVIPEYCPYLNIKLSTDPKDMNEDNYYSGDRIDSSKGYTKGNVQVISLLANKMKNKATQEQLLKFAVNGLNLIKKLEDDGKNGKGN
jgi:hypothetical protein